MATSVAARLAPFALPSVEPKAILRFSWLGPRSCGGGSLREGGLSVVVVDLVFKSLKVDVNVSVDIPEDIDPTTPRKLLFTRRYYHTGDDGKTIVLETSISHFKTAIENIRNLTLRAGLFELSPHRGSTIINRSSGRVTHEMRLLRTDENIKLNIPEIEADATYIIAVTSSDNLDLSATLIKEGGIIAAAAAASGASVVKPPRISPSPKVESGAAAGGPSSKRDTDKRENVAAGVGSAATGESAADDAAALQTLKDLGFK